MTSPLRLLKFFYYFLFSISVTGGIKETINWLLWAGSQLYIFLEADLILLVQAGKNQIRERKRKRRQWQTGIVLSLRNVRVSVKRRNLAQNKRQSKNRNKYLCVTSARHKMKTRPQEKRAMSEASSLDRLCFRGWRYGKERPVY